jgi:hypothetical protein
MLHCFEDCESLFINVRIMEFRSLQTGAHKGNWDGSVERRSIFQAK